MSHPTPPGGGLRKVRRASFVQVPSTTIRDATLSFRARGVLAFLLDHPDGWTVDAAYIARHGKEGREAVEAALRELRAAGYYRLERRRLPSGSFTMGTAIAEEPVAEWAASHAANAGRPVPVAVHVDELGTVTVTELEPASTPADTGNGFPGSGGATSGAGAANYSDSETDSDEEGGAEPGDVTSAPSPAEQAPTAIPPRTCPAHRLTPARGACGPCADHRRAQAAALAELERQDAARVLELAAADRAARSADRELELAELAACDLCDADGTATVVLDGQPDPVHLRCAHDHPANVRRVEARLAAKAATPTTRSTASTRARNRRARDARKA